MKDYVCAECGKTTPYLINYSCQDCLDKVPDYEEIIRERRERDAEYRTRRSEGMTADFIHKEVKQ
ncbi:MAG: hypothetical protein ABIJ35_04630 [Acidobacteriota bacterium]